MRSAVLILLIVCITDFADAKVSLQKSKESEFVWRDPKGKVLESIPERKSKNGFGGWILLTDDMLWEKQWNSKPEYIPTIRTVREMKRQKLMELLVAFSNPKANSNGDSMIKYDVAIAKPNGKVDIIHSNETCFSGKPPSGKGIAMCGEALRIAMDDSDPLGDWKFEVLLKDSVGGTVLDLSTTFKLVP